MPLDSSTELRPQRIHTHTHSRLTAFFSRTTWVGQYQKDKPFWILLKQEMMEWQWHQPDQMQIICTSLKTENHASTSSPSFYGPDALPVAQPTASKHWRHTATEHTRKKLMKIGPAVPEIRSCTDTHTQTHWSLYSTPLPGRSNYYIQHSYKANCFLQHNDKYNAISN